MAAYDHIVSHQERGPDDLKLARVKYYLLAHSIELAFKALLLKHDVSLESLKKIGHDLGELLNMCVQRGFDALDPSEKAALKLLNGYYSSKEFEYFVAGFKTWPRQADVANIARKTLTIATDALPSSTAK